MLIVLISSTISLAFYNSHNQEVKLRVEAKKFADVLDLAKKKAQSSSLIPTPGIPPTYCSDFNGYRVGLTSVSPARFTLKYRCSSNDTTINTYYFPSNIIFTGSAYNFSFMPLGLGTNITLNTVTFKNTTIGKCINILISSVGIVQIDDSLYPCL